MHIESIPLDIGRRRQVLFDLTGPVNLTPEEKEEIWPWVTNWYTNEKANSYASRFNTQRTNYRCIFHSKKTREPAGQGIRARPVRQPLDSPCPFTMAVVAHYSKDGKTITGYTIDRSSINDRCPDHTHDLDKVDSVKRCDGLRAIAHHRMSLMAPNAKANVVYHAMKELPRFEEAGGKYFTNSEVYHVGREFRKQTCSSKRSPEIEEEAKDDGLSPPRWSSQKKRKRVPDGHVQDPIEASSAVPLQSDPARSPKEVGIVSARLPREKPEARKVLFGNIPADDLIPRVKEILSRPSAATRGAGVIGEIDRDIAPRINQTHPRNGGLAHVWQPLSDEAARGRRFSAEPDDRVPTRKLPDGRQVLYEAPPAHADGSSERRASISIGELLWSGLPSLSLRQAVFRPAAERAEKSSLHPKPVAKERWTITDLINKQSLLSQSRTAATETNTPAGPSVIQEPIVDQSPFVRLVCDGDRRHFPR